MLDFLDYAADLGETTDGALELAIKDTSVANYNDGVEDTLVVRIMESGKAMSEPSDGVALAATRTVLDEIMLTCRVLAGMSDKLANGIELVVAWEDKGLLAGLFAFVIFEVYELNKVADKVK